MSDPIAPDPEIAAIALRWFHAYGQGDGEAVFNLMSDDPALNYVGTAEGEYGTGEDFRQAFREYLIAHPRFEFGEQDKNIEAFSSGGIGWAVCRGTVSVTTGFEVHVRVTLIYHLHQGFWRLVHVHNSLPSPNIDGIGKELSDFEALLEAARGTRPDLNQTGLATIMFTDIADSTAIASTIGDSRWSKTVKAHVGLLEQTINDQGGVLIKSLGDGTMSSFPSARAALLTAIALQHAMAEDDSEPQLQIRVGLHTGDLVEQDGDLFGTVVNKAARIAALAAPGEIRVSDATKIMVGGSAFRFSDATSTPLRGLEGEHVIHRLEWRE